MTRYLHRIHRLHPELRGDLDPNPFESFLLGVCVLQGYLVLAGIAHPTALQNTLGNTLRIAWASLLVFGGATSLAGLHWPADLMTGFEIKRVGLFAAGISTATYGAALTMLGSQGWVSAAIQLAFSAACFYRIYQVTRRIRRVRAHLVAARTPEER